MKQCPVLNWKLNKVEKSSSTNCNIPKPELFRIDLNILLLYCEKVTENRTTDIF